MIARFAIDPDAIVATNPADSQRQEDVLRQLARLWLDSGLLILPNVQKSAWRHRLEKLPQQLAIQWRHMITTAGKEGRLREHEGPWPEQYSGINLDDVHELERLIQLLLLDRPTCRQFMKIGEIVGFVPDTELEICDFNFPSAATAFTNARRMRECAAISRGEDVAKALHKLFGALAEISGDALIVDRFALHRFVQSNVTISGIENILVFLRDVHRTRSITLYSAETDEFGDSEFQRLRKLAAKILSGCSVHLALRLVKENYFKSNVHFRYIRLGSDVCIVDEGLQAFEAATAVRFSPCSFRKYDETWKKIEAGLRSASRERLVFQSR